MSKTILIFRHFDPLLDTFLAQVHSVFWCPQILNLPQSYMITFISL